MKLELEALIEGKATKKNMDDNIVISEVEDSNENIWSFLLMSGYLINNMHRSFCKKA